MNENPFNKEGENAMKNKKLLSTLLAIVMLLNWIVPFQMSAVSNGVPEEYSEPRANEGSYPA